MLQIEIVSIGSELLLGKVLDTNGHWLCRQLTLRGGQVRRVVQVRDEVEAIAREVREALHAGCGLVITSGGLGPTEDDVTLAALATALGRPLVENQRALGMIRRRYRELAQQGGRLDATITPARRKMALLPQGAEPVANPVGSAPAVILREGRTVLVCLPGVPEELMSIFGGPLTGLLQELLGTSCYAEWTVFTSGAGESTLAPLLRRIAATHPDVYVKSMAQYPFRGQVPVTLARAGPDEAEVQAGLERALDSLTTMLSQAGIPVERVERGRDPSIPAQAPPQTEPACT